MKLNITLIIITLAGLLIITGCASTTSGTNQTVSVSPRKKGGPVAFDEFIKAVEGARFRDYAEEQNTAVEDEEEFKKMRKHILTMYDGVEVVSAFLLDDHYFDCIPIELQPSLLRNPDVELHLEPPELPDLLKRSEPPPEGTEPMVFPLELGLEDAYGNRVSCSTGAIPMRRIILEDTIRFKNLAEFLRGKKAAPPLSGSVKPPSSPGMGDHHWAVLGHNVENHGGGSWLNGWSPFVGSADQSHSHFSLSQQWFNNGGQTVEGGLQVYPLLYSGSSKARLFTFWTADNYDSTGCYNLSCSGFVQTNNSWPLGGAFTSYSEVGGFQGVIRMRWIHAVATGDWWLYLQTGGDLESVGYYPQSLFAGGQLGEFAKSVSFGGETTDNEDGTWPSMGSGQMAQHGWQQAAFQSDVFYVDRNLSRQSVNLTDLIIVMSAPNCYTIDFTPASQAGSWRAYFDFGGPGSGHKC